jgi:RNA polymerase sigma-70 factor, ECF subfamily
MQPTLRNAAATLSVNASGRGVPRGVLDHLGHLLRSALTPSRTDRFAELLAKLDPADAVIEADVEKEVRAGLLRLLPNLRRFAASLTHDATAAEDVVQDAMLRAWRGRRGFQPGSNIEAWLFTITRNVFFSRARVHGREIDDADGERAARLTVAPEQGGRVDLSDARAALARLPASMREALMLIAVEDMSYADAASILGCRIGTVKSRVWRARERLAKVLGYDGSEVGNDGLMLAAASPGTRKSLPLQ